MKNSEDKSRAGMIDDTMKDYSILFMNGASYFIPNYFVFTVQNLLVPSEIKHKVSTAQLLQIVIHNFAAKR